ncbi:hypothetical protein ACQEVX_35100 [Streptomyces syringium]|uniref:hypothetical protein n=1 Tax=Streptomyces syringium TaxID=76729 RepID=UPI003D8E8DEE
MHSGEIPQPSCQEATVPVDPTDPDTFEAEGTATIEMPEIDSAEQHTYFARQCDAFLADGDPDSADECDRAEQARVVELNEDDYR